MLIDDSRAPLIFLRSGFESPVPIEAQLEILLDRGQRFVLVTDQAQHRHDDESAEARRQKALFFKRIKTRLRTLCRGLIVLEDAGSTSAPMRVAATAAGKALGFAVAFAADEDAALRQGQAWLAEPA